MSRRLAAVLALALLSPATARATMLPDSTVLSSWRLANGLEVRARQIPHAGGVAITMAWRAGRGYEPPRQPGLAELLAELQLRGGAGDVPERTRDEMASLRPLGWGLDVGPRLVRVTEIATLQQFPGVLRQVAARAGGVTVNEPLLRAAIAQVRRDRGDRMFGDAGQALYWRTEAMARGESDDEMVAGAAARGLDALTVEAAQSALARLYVPANAVLALAGDLSGVDVRALVEHEFGAIPAGAAMPDTVRDRFVAGARVSPWPGLAAPVGAVAARGPAISDSLHPAFYLGMLVTGAGLGGAWGRPAAPLTSRFNLSLFDDPEVVRFYPAIKPDAHDPVALSNSLNEQLNVLGETAVTAGSLDRVRHSVDWLLGGPLTADVARSFATEPSSLGTLTGSMASRALWRGDAFWDRYRERFEQFEYGHTYFYARITPPERQVRLLLVPGR